jgi:hypothetical protein
MRWGSWRRFKQPKRSEAYKRNYTLALQSEHHQQSKQAMPEAKPFDASGSSPELRRSMESMWKEFGRDPRQMTTRARVQTERANRGE